MYCSSLVTLSLFLNYYFPSLLLTVSDFIVFSSYDVSSYTVNTTQSQLISHFSLSSFPNGRSTKTHTHEEKQSHTFRILLNSFQEIQFYISDSEEERKLDTRRENIYIDLKTNNVSTSKKTLSISHQT